MKIGFCSIEYFRLNVYAVIPESFYRNYAEKRLFCRVSTQQSNLLLKALKVR